MSTLVFGDYRGCPAVPVCRAATLRGLPAQNAKNIKTGRGIWCLVVDAEADQQLKTVNAYRTVPLRCVDRTSIPDHVESRRSQGRYFVR